METKLLASLGKLAGLAGIAVGALVLIFQDVLKQKFLPNTGLSEPQAYRVVIALLVLTFGIAATGIAAWVIGQRTEQVRPSAAMALLGFGIVVLAATVFVAVHTSAADGADQPAPLAPYQVTAVMTATGQKWLHRVIPHPYSKTTQAGAHSFLIDSQGMVEIKYVCPLDWEGWVVDTSAPGFSNGLKRDPTAQLKGDAEVLDEQACPNEPYFACGKYSEACIKLLARGPQGSATAGITGVFVAQKKLVPANPCANPQSASKVILRPGHSAQISTFDVNAAIGDCDQSLMPQLTVRTEFRDLTGTLLETHDVSSGQAVSALDGRVTLSLSSLGLLDMAYR